MGDRMREKHKVNFYFLIFLIEFCNDVGSPLADLRFSHKIRLNLDTITRDHTSGSRRKIKISCQYYYHICTDIVERQDFEIRFVSIIEYF